MMRLLVLVEGPTELDFVNHLLSPHLREFSVFVSTAVVTTRRDRNGRKYRGGGHWRHWRADLLRHTGENPGKDVRFTTLFDLYGLPDDFPELERHEADRDTLRRAQGLERAMQDVVEDWRLIPYLQRHEMEALVLASLDALSELLDLADRPAVDKLRAAVERAGGPEEVNDGRDSAPSKRLEREIPGYAKTTHGPLAMETAGLAVIRSQCPRFDAWLTRLESLAGISP